MYHIHTQENSTWLFTLTVLYVYSCPSPIVPLHPSWAVRPHIQPRLANTLDRTTGMRGASDGRHGLVSRPGRSDQLAYCDLANRPPAALVRYRSQESCLTVPPRGPSTLRSSRLRCVRFPKSSLAIGRGYATRPPPSATA